MNLYKTNDDTYEWKKCTSTPTLSTKFTCLSGKPCSITSAAKYFGITIDYSATKKMAIQIGFKDISNVVPQSVFTVTANSCILE